MNDALELLCAWLETNRRQIQKDDPQWREFSAEANARMEAFYRTHRRNKPLVHAVNDLLDALWFQAEREARLSLLLGLQMGAALDGAGPLRWEP
ncbi:hypothetical protein [Dysosmobacter sp. Phy]